MKKIILFSIIGFLFAPMQAAEKEPFKITHGPYLQEMGETQVSILWTTNQNAVSWVEVAPDDGTHFYFKERPKFYSASHGIKDVSKIHKVTLENLKPGTTYRYRVYSQELLSHERTEVLYGRTVATDVYRKKPLKFTTNNSAKPEISFLILNDIHGRSQMIGTLWESASLKTPDLVFFNGDMVSLITSETQLFEGFMDDAVKLFASEIPMYYSRGNHETRGVYAQHFAKYFPGDSGQLYYMFRQGPVCFLVLDSGEDKPDSDKEYGGLAAFDTYRKKQADWLKDAIQSDIFKNAPYRVVIMHMPPPGTWHGAKDAEDRFMPLLNSAKVDIMFSGHLHKHIIRKPGAGFNFPIVVNSNNNIVKVSTDKGALKVEIKDQQGKLVEALSTK